MTNLQYGVENKEKYNLFEDDTLCDIAFKFKYNRKDCEGIECAKCEFNSMIKAVYYLLQEHEDPIKLKQWEYDLIKMFSENLGQNSSKFFSIFEVITMKQKGYFKGITNTSITIKEILDNCEIVSDNYEDFDENCK